MAEENLTWGDRRIQGVLANGGYHIDKITVRNILRRYHVDTERNHQGLGDQLIASEPDIGGQDGRVARRERLGGVLSYSHREAA
jgi:hypothetical protein